MVLCASALLLTLTTPARAADVAAEALFQEGRALLAKGRIEEAKDRFQRSQELEPRVGTLFSLGECFERSRLYASAWGAYQEAANLALKLGDDRAESARTKAAEVAPHLARLTLSIEALPQGVSITRNGTKVDTAALDTAIPVDPGTQSVVVSAPHRKSWQGRLELREGEAGRLPIPSLEVLPGEPAAPSEGEPATSTRSNVALGLEIGGGVVLAAGLVMGALAISTWSSVQDACPSARCPSEAERARLADDEKRASTFATVSTVTSLVGGVALGTGIVLHLTAPSRRISIAPMVDRATGGFVATLRL
jgi:hypothetical protein